MQVIREINKGGFGVVEEVLMPDGSRMARKTFQPAFSISSGDEYEKLVRRFKREARVQSSLNSAGFMPIIGDGLACAQPYYLMPLADRNFWQEIQDAKISGTSLQKALADVLNSLDELHELGFVHRDLKPANILLHDGVWKLSDFGLVLPPGGATTKLTSIDSNWGTAGYCAPEQSIEFRNATPLVDIYAFGCILHDIYGDTARVPYQRYSSPGEIGVIIEKCTEVRPEKRFQSVRALRGALLTLLSTSPDVALSPATSDWVDMIATAASWDKTTIERFVRFTSSAEQSDLYAVFRNFDEDSLSHVFDVDQDLFKTLSAIYCEWIEGCAFAWDSCDVLIRRIENIFELGDIETKATAVLAGAKLGYGHNRWFVMRRVINMCGHAIEDAIARRIAVEISAQEAESSFVACARVINRDVVEYHPRIAGVLL